MSARSRFVAATLAILLPVSGCQSFSGKQEDARSLELSASQDREQALSLAKNFGDSLVDNPYNPAISALSQAGKLLGEADKKRGIRQAGYSYLLARHAIASALIERGVRPQHGELDGFFTPEQGLTSPETMSKDKLKQEAYESALVNFLANQQSAGHIVNAFHLFDESYQRENP